MVWRNPEIETYDLNELSNVIKAKAYSYVAEATIEAWVAGQPTAAKTFYNVTLYNETLSESFTGTYVVTYAYTSLAKAFVIVGGVTYYVLHGNVLVRCPW